MKQCLKTVTTLLMCLSATAGHALRLQTKNEYNGVALATAGVVPTWLRGHLVKNCTVPIFDDGKNTTHLFDGVAMLQSFTFEAGKVLYSSRFLESNSYAKVLASDPEFYQRDVNANQWNHIQDAGVNVFNYDTEYVALTESPLPVKFELGSLKQRGNFEFADQLPKSGAFESAHPQRDAKTGEIFNYLIEYGEQSYYVLYKLTKSTREVIAKVPVAMPGYMHSFAMTENHLILVEFPLVLDPQRLATAHFDSFASYIRLFDWKPEQGTRFIVLNRKTGETVSQIKTTAFFSFHHANAYEHGDEIIIDLTANNFAKFEKIFPQGSGQDNTIQGLYRFRLNTSKQDLVTEKILGKALDFPKAPEHLAGYSYRFLYMIDHEPKDSALVKYDWQEKKELRWHVPNATILEPSFVPAPNARDEDDGVLLTIVTDRTTQLSRLMILDAKNLSEIGNADLPESFPKSFHGQFFAPKEKHL